MTTQQQRANDSRDANTGRRIPQALTEALPDAQRTLTTCPAATASLLAEETDMQSKHAWVLLVAGIGILHAASPAPALNAADDDRSFHAFLRDFERGTTRFINGDPGPWKANVSQRDDVTLLGGWGIVAHGAKDAAARYDWAAQRFVESGAALQVEYVSTVVSGDLAYTVAIERSTVRLAGAATTAPMILRVTHAFRKENGHWKLLHRHADPLIDTTAPASVLKP